MASAKFGADASLADLDILELPSAGSGLSPSVNVVIMISPFSCHPSFRHCCDFTLGSGYNFTLGSRCAH